jgi:hypothetical protein
MNLESLGVLLMFDAESLIATRTFIGIDFEIKGRD